MRKPLLLLLTFVVSAQQPPQTGVTFSTTTNLVVLNVAVRDSSGAPVTGLKREDFTVLEDDKPQTISVFEFQKLELDPLPPVAPSPGAPPPAAAAARLIATSAPGSVRYQDRRLLVLFFDLSSMPPADQIRAQEAGLKFIDRQLTASDMVSIMTFATRLQVQQDFTSDREKLKEVIKSFRLGEGSEMAENSDAAGDDEGEDTGAAFTADETEFNIFNTDRKLSALESAAKMLAPLAEKKALVYFSSGVGKTGVENDSQIRSTVNAAIRANVSFYPVDARGLTALPPGGDASKSAPRGSGIFSGQAQRKQSAKFNDQQETLSTLAADTGGKALLDSNDLGEGIVAAQKDIRSYYIVGYYSTNTAEDGRFRKIRVRLEGQPRARLDYRQGYYAAKQYAKFDASEKERQLEEALALADPVTDLPIALEVNYFRMTREKFFVPVAVKIPGSMIGLRRKGKSEVGELDFIGEVRDEKGKAAGAVRDTIPLKLSEQAATRIGRRQLQYDTGFTLVSGTYRLKFLARENRSGKIGTFETKFTVPVIDPRQPGLQMSSVVWSGQREHVAAAVGAAESPKKVKKKTDLHPLVQDGQKLIPSITRVFRRDQNLYVYFEVYYPTLDPQEKTPSLAAGVSFFKGNGKVFESAAIRAAAPSRPQTVSFQIQAPLARFAPGEYLCQVNVVDELGGKFAFRRTPLVVVP
jgi:VWFA-related protein